MLKKLHHETVLVTPPLPVWIFYHHYPMANHIAAHWHQAIELSFTLSGSIDCFKIGGKTFKTKPGQILVVNSQVIHSIDVVSRKNNAAFSLSIPYGYLESLFPKLKEVYFDLNNPQNFSETQLAAYIKLQGLFYTIVQRYQAQDRFKFIDLQAEIANLLQILIKYFTKPLPNEIILNTPKTYALDRLHNITQFVNENYQNEIGLTEIANYCNISKVYLARFFKQHMELTI